MPPTIYNFRRSDFTTFWSHPQEFVQKFLHPENFTPNENMQFGTICHAIREKENGEFGEVRVEVPLGGHLIHGTFDYYDGKEVCDYKYSQKINDYKQYVGQIAFYQFLIWEKYKLAVPGRLEFVEVAYNPFADPEFTLTGVVKNYNFKKPTAADLKKFETKVLSAMKQMIYLLERAKMPKPTRPKSTYTPSQLKEMSADLPEEMRTRKNIRYSTKPCP